MNHIMIKISIEFAKDAFHRDDARFCALYAITFMHLIIFQLSEEVSFYFFRRILSV